MSEPPTTPTSPDSDLLRRHLADRDEPCPHCRYNLRGLTGDRCPECGFALRLMLAPSINPRPLVNRVFTETHRALKMIAAVGAVSLFVHAIAMILAKQGRPSKLPPPLLHPAPLLLVALTPWLLYLLWGRARESIIGVAWWRANLLALAALACAVGCVVAAAPFRP